MGKAKPNPPAAPFFKPVDIGQAMQQALQYDVAGYSWSDQDFVDRFPGLVATRNSQIDDAYNQLTGPLDPTLQQDFTNKSLEQGLGAFGGGDPLSALGMTQGSVGRNTATAGFANQLIQNQDQNRSNFDQLLGQNLQRSFGLGGSDIAGLEALNTGTLNSVNQQAYASQLAGIYGQGQQNVATGQQIAALGSILARLR